MNLIYLTLPLKAAANGTAIATFAPPTSSDTWVLEALSVMPQATSATNGTDYATISYYVATSTAIATARTTASVSLTAGTAVNATLTGTPTQLEITQSNRLHVDVSQAASGVAVDCIVTARFRIVRQMS